MYLLCSGVQQTGDVGNQGRTLLEVIDSAHEDYQHEWLWRVNDGCIVVNFGDLPGFMRYSRADRQPCGNALVESLLLQDADHLARCCNTEDLLFRQGFEQRRETSRAGRIVQSLIEGLLIFHTAQYVHPISMDLVD